MFNSIRGVVSGKKPSFLCVENGGVEWEFCVSDSTAATFNVGDEARIFTHLQHRDDAMTLFGFATEEERAIFFDLQKVDGIGPKAAIKILSKSPATNLAAILNEGDLAALEALPGIGKKTAQKMLLALKGKLSLDETSAETRSRSTMPAVSDALVEMGYDRKAVDSAIAKILQDAADLSGKEREDYVFRRAIVELA